MSNYLILIYDNVRLNIHKVQCRFAKTTAKTRPRESFHPVNGSRNRRFGGGQMKGKKGRESFTNKSASAFRFGGVYRILGPFFGGFFFARRLTVFAALDFLLLALGRL